MFSITVLPRYNIKHAWSIPECATKPTRERNVAAVVLLIQYMHVLTYYLHVCGRVNPCVYPLKYHSLCVPHFTSCMP